MTFPIDFHIGSMVIASHPVFELLAFFIGYRYFLYLKYKNNKVPLPPQSEWWIIIGAAIGAFIGSRLISGLENPVAFFDPTTWLYFIGNQTILGGIAGGILGVEISKKILKVKRKTGDLFVYPLILGMIIGRIGCFLTGVKDGTVGLPSSLPWAFDQEDGIPRHPTSLYEIAFLIIVWIIVMNVEKKKTVLQGDLFSIFVFGYALFRLLEEFLKPRIPLFIGLTSIQLLGLILVIYYSIYFYRNYQHIKKHHDHS